MGKQYEFEAFTAPDLVALDQAAKREKILTQKSQEEELAKSEAFRSNFQLLAADLAKLTMYEKIYAKGMLSQKNIPLYLAAKQYRLNHY